MYETGRNFPQDYQLAAYWYRCAADQGNVHAQYLLGLLYDRGQGVPLNYVEAHKWLNLAAARAGSGDRDYFVRIRNAVASKLTRAQIYESQQRSREWTLGCAMTAQVVPNDGAVHYRDTGNAKHIRVCHKVSRMRHAPPSNSS